MGKHAAPEGASADPIVTEALARRPGDAVHHAAAEGPVGWPGERAPEGGRVGWPGDLPGATAETTVARRSWRRLFAPTRVA
ncbi:hypothetical protein FHU33_0637 [Blastococcus colisei]|uniref:Uncharacterized protein n=1 Tax=Blastococcus colisei TaxID=1564162 RepID=A0A543PB10_9ACTN|nr:hypothetical protein [Blastococcus colisei]TQN41274.1 hypothetical protein FHU33_0637 [Blastococcus colisei]